MKARSSSEDLEANALTISGGRRKKTVHACLLLASVLAVTALLSAAVGFVTGLGVIRSEESLFDGCPVDVDVESPATNNLMESTEVMVHSTKCPVHPFPSPLSSPPPEKIESAISTLNDQLAQLIDAEKMPGLVASVMYRDQELWSKGFGVTQKGPDGVTPHKGTIYRIASVSKIFVVLLVYQLFDRGLLRSLDDPLNMFCPNFHINNPFTTENITLRQIISSMSGLPREAPCALPVEPSVNLCPYNTTTILQRLSQQSTILPPWTQPSYSNLGFALLGHCLVPYFYPHMSYEDYIGLNILKPLGMTDTGFKYSHSVLERLATGYTLDGSVESVYDVGWWGPAGQMYSTLQDLNKLAQFFYSTGVDEEPIYSTVLSTNLRRMMLLPTYTNGDMQTGIGAPWEVWFQDGYTVLMKGGNLRGYSALFSIVPDLKLGFNILFSGVTSKLSLANKVYTTLIPAFVEAITVPPVFPLPPNATLYTGIYTASWSSSDIAIANVHLHQGSLALSGSAFSGIFLAYREDFRFQIEFSNDGLSCLSSELLALRHTWLYFDHPQPHSSSQQATSFTMPGYSPGLHFMRI